MIQKNNKTIALINEGYGNNLGDQAIVQCLVEIVSHQFYTKIIPFAHNQSKFLSPSIKGSIKIEYFRKCSRIIPSKIKARIKWWILGERNSYRMFITKNIEGCDGLIVGGGQLVKSNISLFAERLDVIREVCQRLSIPYSLFGVGVDADIDLICKKSVYNFLKQAAYLCVRDKQSKEKIMLYGIATNLIKVYPDLAFSKTFEIEPSDKLKNRKHLGINIIGYDVFRKNSTKNAAISYQKYLNFWTQITVLAAGDFNTISLFTTGATCDYEDALEVKNMVNHSGSQMQVSLIHPTSLNDLYENLANMSHGVVSRMHAGILGFTSGMQCVAMVWDDKVADCWTTIEQHGRVFSSEILHDPLGAKRVYDQLSGIKLPLITDLIAAEIRLGVDLCVTRMLDQ
jgi:polysaccharide pyruvyl transferase WcaK-like protein